MEPRIIIANILYLALYFTAMSWVLYSLLSFTPQAKNSGWYGSEDYKDTIEQHETHGILVSVEGIHGWYFERDGKVCWIEKRHKK